MVTGTAGSAPQPTYKPDRPTPALTIRLVLTRRAGGPFLWMGTMPA